MRHASPACTLPWVVLLILVVGLAAALPAGPARAQAQPDAATKARRLDGLFARLQSTQDEAEADGLVAQIWDEWVHSGTSDLDERMQQASALMGQGLAALALAGLTDLVERAPDWAEAWNKRATAFYLVGQHESSLADIERVLALEPRHFGALAGMGLIHIARGEHREALAAYRRALVANPFLKERGELIPALERLVGEKPI